MGCRHSRSDELVDAPVESIQYRKRSSIWRFGRGKKCKKSTKSASSNRTARSGSSPESEIRDDTTGHVGDGETYMIGSTAEGTSTPSEKRSSSANPSSTADGNKINASANSNSNLKSNSSSGGGGKNKNINEHVQIFGNDKSVNNVLSLSVENSDSPEVEAKHARFGGNNSVFPIWESSFTDQCMCGSKNTTDSNTNNQQQATTTLSSTQHHSSEVDRRRDSSVSTGSKLCRRCSQSVETVPNNLRGVAGNNNSDSNTTALPGGNGGGGGGQDNSTKGSITSHSETKNSQLAAIANLLVLAALDLSAPASSVLVKNRKNAWIQLAGHPGSFAPAGPNTIWKKRIAKENYETLAYQALNDYHNCKSIMPAFYREVEFNGEYFIEMEDLLQHFNDPSIMDIKMGHRTFLEAEVKNPVLRKDLFEKMIKLDPNAPTEEEKAQGAITKLRYMQFRENESSTANLGFRIEAIRMSGEPPNTNLKKVKTKDEVSYFIKAFTKNHECVIPTLWERLKDIRDSFEAIPFFRTHEIIGSSLLIMFDSSNHAGAWMIDFAKTIPVPDLKVNHRSPWQLGNHEDGYLFGLDNLTGILGELAEQYPKETKSAKDVDAVVASVESETATPVENGNHNPDS